MAGVGFEVYPGEVLGLVGESGCGKSLTALTVMGLTPKGARVGGQVRFRQRDLLAEPMRARRRLLGHEMAMVYQDALSSLNPAMTIRAQLKQLVRRGGRRSPGELLSLVGLDPERTLRSYPHELSGGQRQRVLIAMALSRDPKLIVADEPTTALDVTVQAQIMELLLRLRAELGFALILVSHDLALVADVTDRVVVMYGGQIVETGVTAELVAAPAHHYTRGLLGSVLSLESAAQPDDADQGGRPGPGRLPGGLPVRRPLPARHRGVPHDRAGPRGHPRAHDRLPPPGGGADIGAERGGPAVTAVVEVRDAHVVHEARSGGLFRRDRVYALTGAALAVAPGETVGVVGESGCGKSTLAKVLVGIERPVSGTVSFRGRDLWAMPAAERRATVGAGTGMIFQDPSTALNRRLTVRRVLRDPLDVHRRGTRAEREERVRELMALVGLPPALADALPGQLSGGQRQRVAIARALALDPALVVADEPTSALDVSVRAQILNLLLDLKERLGLAPGVRLARHPDGTADERPGDHHVPGPDRGGGPGRLGHRRRPAPVHPRPVLGDTRPAGPRRTDPADRAGALGDPPAQRLPVPHPLLEGGRGVRHVDAGLLGRVTAGAPVPVPPSCGGGPADPRPSAPGA